MAGTVFFTMCQVQSTMAECLENPENPFLHP